MKKVLNILSTISLSTIITTNIIACQQPNKNNINNIPNKPIEPEFIPQQPPKDSNWKLIDNISNENLQKEINVKNSKWYIAIGKNKRENPLYNSVVKFNSNWDVLTISGNISFGNDNYYSLKDIKNIYRWDGIGEPIIPTINKDTSEITNWNEKIES